MSADTRARALTPERYLMAIGGEHYEAASGRTFESIDPYTGIAWATAPDGSAEDVDRAVAAARRALEGDWGRMDGFERAASMRRLAGILERDVDALAEIETRDNGRLLSESLGQVSRLPEWLYWFAGLADKIRGETIPTSPDRFLAYTRREPVGVVAAIVPWNAPLLLLMWKLAPALAAGCTVVVKPSDHTPISALELARRIDEAGLPPGVFNVVTGFGPAVGQALSAHPGVGKVAFTGSTATGTAVGRTALENMTRFSLELGGKSAQVVFEDAALDAAVAGVSTGIFTGTGQVCMAGSRLIVDERIHDELVARVVERARALRIGAPREPETEIGPVANRDQLDRVLGYLEGARADGAQVACGGGSPRGQEGLFVEPTVLTGVRPEMTIAQEEVFGPVLCVMAFATEDEAIELANATSYGLAAGVWTTNVHRAHRVAHRLKAGTVWVNAYRTFGPSVPFGGYGKSGLGRENGFEALHEYTETKAIWIELDGQAESPPGRS